jgi:hypothetical protein
LLFGNYCGYGRVFKRKKRIVGKVAEKAAEKHGNRFRLQSWIRCVHERLPGIVMGENNG